MCHEATLPVSSAILRYWEAPLAVVAMAVPGIPSFPAVAGKIASPQRGPERDGLENRCTGNRTVGSNPTLSAIYPHFPREILGWGFCTHLRTKRRFSASVSARCGSCPPRSRRHACVGHQSLARGYFARWVIPEVFLSLRHASFWASMSLAMAT